MIGKISHAVVFIIEIKYCSNYSINEPYESTFSKVSEITSERATTFDFDITPISLCSHLKIIV